MRTAHPLGLSPDGRNLIVVIDGLFTIFTS